MQGAPQITGSVQNTDDFRPVIQRTIKDDISTEGQTVQPGTSSSRTRPISGYEASSWQYRIVARYEVANFDEIALGALREA